MSSHHGILIHVVFSTKYRKPVIKVDWQDDLYAYIGGALKDHKASLLKSGGIADHVHLLIKTHPQFAISSTMQMLKANSSRWINDNQRLGFKFQWQSGYGAFSVSQSQVDKVKTYIENQHEHHKTKSFKEEYLEILKRHEIAYDERFVFEQEIVA